MYICLDAVTKPMRAVNSSSLRQRFETVHHNTETKRDIRLPIWLPAEEGHKSWLRNRVQG